MTMRQQSMMISLQGLIMPTHKLMTAMAALVEMMCSSMAM
jgi:hypothetical protein